MHKLLGNFQAKFYTARKNFTGPPVPTVLTNFKSEFASLLESSLIYFSFSQLSLTGLSRLIDSQHSMFESVVPLVMLSLLSLGTWKYDALYLSLREKVSGWLKWNHGVSLRWHSRGRWWVGGLLPRLLPPAMTPAIALHHILRNTRMISASPSSSSSKRSQ